MNGSGMVAAYNMDESMRYRMGMEFGMEGQLLAPTEFQGLNIL
jgi:hypothetical protein